MLLKMYLNATYSEVHIGRYLSKASQFRLVQNKEVLYPKCFSNLL